MPRRCLKAGLIATTFAAMTLVPVSGVVTLATVDVAYAKNGNGNGGGRGDGGERGGGNRGGEARAERGDGGNGRNGGARGQRARADDPISAFVRSLRGGQERTQRQEAREAAQETRAARRAPTEFAPQASIPPARNPARASDMRPSQLGNMNGALNANINAVLAHIRNGNTRGPVGQLAALAIADAAFADAARTMNEDALAGLLADEGYATVDDYYTDLRDNPDMERNADLDAALLALGADPLREQDYVFTPPTVEELDASTEAMPELTEARLAAEESVLSSWNKNGDADPAVLSPEEESLLDDLRNRLVANEAEIEAAIEASRVPATEDEEAACMDVAGCATDEVFVAMD